MGSIGVIAYYHDNTWVTVEEFLSLPGSSFGWPVTLLEVPGIKRPEILLHRKSWYHWQAALKGAKDEKFL